MVTSIKIFGEKLGIIRREHFLSQDGLGRKLDMAGGSIGRLEQQAVAGMLPENFLKLAEVFKLTTAELLAKIGVPEGSNGHVSLLVPQDVAQAAQEAAQRVGRDPADWMVDRLRDAVARARPSPPGVKLKTAARTKDPKRGKE